MKKITIFVASTVLAFAITSCKKESKQTTVNDELPQTVASQIRTLGFNTDGAQKVNGGYLVEGDIILSDADLAAVPTSPELVVGNEEHYRTNNLVSVGSYPTIKVALSSSSSSHSAAFTAALDEAIRRYNAEGLRIRFQRVSSGQHITVNAYYQVSNTLGSAGFPSSSGAPYSQVQMNTYWYSTSTGSTNVNYIATVMSHELGHCIGFRHTDYMNRAYSCGGYPTNEGSAGVGAVYIPGTPSGPSSGSWMLACTASNQNRPFTTADRTALNYVY
jgi:Dual-action HEIGH metallo-peptidase